MEEQKVRSIEELLIDMREHQELFRDGLCGWAIGMYGHSKITLEEYMILKKYIKANRPGLFESVKSFIAYIQLEAYYWKIGEIAPRIEWLEKHIKLNKANEK